MDACTYCNRLVFRPGSIEVRDDPWCQKTRDHTIPACNGGTVYVTACRGCNEIKDHYPLEVFEFFMANQPAGKPVKALKREMRQFVYELTRYGFAQAKMYATQKLKTNGG